jgi:PleD family two-component response regulator
MDRVGNAAREKILIVDDTGLHRAVTADALARRGYATVQAETGQRALETVNGERPDLVILDARMPGLDGLDVVRRLKENPFTRHIPVLVVSGDSTPSQVESLRSGADSYLGKPFPAEELVARVETLLRASSPVNPLSNLPAAPLLQRRLNARLAQNLPTAIVYADADHFRAYNQYYGESAGDQVLRAMAHLMTDTLPGRGGFVAHLGADDLVAVLAPPAAETYAQTLIDQFLRLRDTFHPADDLARRHFVLQGAWGEPREVPLISLSAVLVTNEQRVLTGYVQVSELLLQTMRFLKAQGGGNWARDRRTR